MEYGLQSAGPTLRIIALVFLLVFVALALLVTVVLAALPGQIAKRRQHAYADAVNIAGWLGLPTGIVWVLAMVWAHMSPKPTPQSKHSQIDPLQLETQIQSLEALVDSMEASGQGAKS
ncbi:DUF3302 domain-containing protein [Rhodopirellula halodulae]|nr:DUF3302 domain-containing protein [Rhodopirellula sp. JC737]MCC9656775.1 DUF3302 domain-containing protein [Rhodopirellula sp. JC737]